MEGMNSLFFFSYTIQKGILVNSHHGPKIMLPLSLPIGLLSTDSKLCGQSSLSLSLAKSLKGSFLKRVPPCPSDQNQTAQNKSYFNASLLTLGIDSQV